MAKLQVSISVNNPDEVISKEKGKLIGLASKLLSKDKRKEKVESEILLTLKEELGAGLVTQLKERGIESEIKVDIID
ncbi:MAG: hypothetical protein ACPGVD_07595 [Flavobacteriales bacterium]